LSSNLNVHLRERLKLPPSELFFESYYKPHVARMLLYIFEHEIWLHITHVNMLEKQAIIQKRDADDLIRVLLDLADGGPGVLNINYELEDLYSYVEKWIVDRVGPETGGRLHTGRSRNDLHTTSWRMALRDLVADVLGALADLRAAALDLASKNIETVMPGYTHLQHAQPITLGYYFLTFADVLGRDWRRLSSAYSAINRSPLGAGALATTAFPIDRRYTAEALGFDGLVEIAYDGVACRDDAAEATAALSLLMTNVSRLCFDLQLWSTLEYGFVEFGDQHASVSSIMPQKKNPSALEHCKSMVGMVNGAHMAVLSVMKNTSFADVIDGASGVNEPALDASVRTRRVIALMAEVVGALTVRPEVMRKSAEKGFGTATELADVIVREAGLSFRMAHNIVAAVVRDTIAADKSAMDITTEDVDRAALELFNRKLNIPAEKVSAALDPFGNVKLRIVEGGPAPDNMVRMLEQRLTALADDHRWLTAARDRIVRSRDEVFKTARTRAETLGRLRAV
jgi:argininosuccinate lyase